MNKKVSTLLTVALTLGGSLLSSSAFAESVKSLVGGDGIAITDFSAKDAAGNKYSGQQFAMVQTIAGQQYAYGFEEEPDGTIKQIVVKYDVDKGFKSEDLSKFAWEVTEFETFGIYHYTFKNVATGKFFEVVKDENGNPVVNTEGLSGGENKIVFSAAKPKYNGSFVTFNTAFGTGWTYASVNDGGTENDFSDDEMTLSLTWASGTYTPSKLEFFNIKSKTIDEGLNGLYNKKGFNFDVKTPSGVTVENIFAATNKSVKAIRVTSTVKAGDQETGFPAGTYFVVATPEGKEYDDINGTSEEKYNYLKACTFIALSSTECYEVTPAERETGKGFKLIEIAGSDNNLNLYIGSALNKISTDTQVSIWNACFDVEANLSDYPFSIDVPKFRFKKQEAADKKDHATAAVALDIVNYASNSYALASKPGSNAFVFKYSQSSIKNVLELLNTDRTASVYNIKFVSGNGDETENGKYLTFGNNANSHDWVAKGESLSKAALATPAYQFVITAANPKTNEVTFTNRESGESITTQLFKDGEVDGETIYTMALSSGSDDDFIIANVDLNDYEVAPSATQKFNNVQVVITKSTVDTYAGFLNEEEGKMYTLNFGRDVNSTSNRLYAYVGSSDAMVSNNHANVTSEFSDATLWKLVPVKNADKTNKELKFQRSFAYNSNGTVQTEPFGDVVTMPVYNLEYIYDADETGKYLAQDSKNYKVSTNATNFIIRLNADGSVDLLGEASANETTDKMNIASSSNGLKPNGEYYDYEVQNTYAITENATSIKTYLGETSPIKSWKAETGHVSLQTQNGNYISMNEDRDGIVVANEPEVYYLHVADKDAIVPSFYISRGMDEGSNAASERMFLFNPVDSAKYYVGPGEYDRNYAWDKEHNKALFKTGRLNATADTLTMTVKGVDSKKVAMKADNKGVWGGLNRFKFQIVECPEEDGYYYIRQLKASETDETLYLSNIGDKLTWTNAKAGNINRLLIAVKDAEAPTSNEGVAASEVKVVAQDGAVVVKNAAGKNVVVSTILGQVVANEVLTSDNATINVPAGIVVVAVEGESFKVNVK